MNRRPHRHPASPVPWCELTAMILRGVPTLPNAACRGHPRLFDGDTPEHRSKAIEICQHCCPEIHNCHKWAAALPNSRRVSGVVAGKYRNGIHRKEKEIPKQ